MWVVQKQLNEDLLSSIFFNKDCISTCWGCATETLYNSFEKQNKQQKKTKPLCGFNFKISHKVTKQSGQYKQQQKQ